MEAENSQAKVVNLHEHAAENLKFIRETMHRSVTFTGVTGKGMVFCGVIACIVSWMAAGQIADTWLGMWGAAFIVATSVSFWLTFKKTADHGQSLFEGNGRQLMLAFIPALGLGGVMTLSVIQGGDYKSLPGIWLSLYGLGITTGGAWSVKAIPLLGAVLMLLGSVTLLTPVSGDLMMALGFGVLHISFGIYIWRAHGG